MPHRAVEREKRFCLLRPVHDGSAAAEHNHSALYTDPQTLAREMVVEVEHSRVGRIRTIGLPVKFSDTPGPVRTGSPTYGQHSREVLEEHRFGAAEIDALIAEGAVVAAKAEPPASCSF